MHSSGSEQHIEETRPSMGAMEWIVSVRAPQPKHYVHVLARVADACKVPELSKHMRTLKSPDAIILSSKDGVPITKSDIDLLMKGVPSVISANLKLPWRPYTELLEVKPVVHAIEEKAKAVTGTIPVVTPEQAQKHVVEKTETSAEDELVERARGALRKLGSELASVNNLLRAKEKELAERIDEWRAEELEKARKTVDDTEHKAKVDASVAHKKQREAHVKKMAALDAKEKKYSDAATLLLGLDRDYKNLVRIINGIRHMPITVEDFVNMINSPIFGNQASAVQLAIFLTEYRLGNREAHVVVADALPEAETKLNLPTATVIRLMVEIHPLMDGVKPSSPMSEQENYSLFRKVIASVVDGLDYAKYQKTIDMIGEYCTQTIKEVQAQKLTEIRDDAKAHQDIDDKRDATVREARAARSVRIEDVEREYMARKGNLREMLEKEAPHELERLRALQGRLDERARPFGVDGKQLSKGRSRG